MLGDTSGVTKRASNHYVVSLRLGVRVPDE